jgi:hypothetical protein
MDLSLSQLTGVVAAARAVRCDKVPQGSCAGGSRARLRQVSSAAVAGFRA